jgi:hypothetical protein
MSSQVNSPSKQTKYFKTTQAPRRLVKKRKTKPIKLFCNSNPNNEQLNSSNNSSALMSDSDEREPFILIPTSPHSFTSSPASSPSSSSLKVTTDNSGTTTSNTVLNEKNSLNDMNALVIKQSSLNVAQVQVASRLEKAKQFARKEQQVNLISSELNGCESALRSSQIISPFQTINNSPSNGHINPMCNMSPIVNSEHTQFNENVNQLIRNALNISTINTMLPLCFATQSSNGFSQIAQPMESSSSSSPSSLLTSASTTATPMFSSVQAGNPASIIQPQSLPNYMSQTLPLNKFNYEIESSSNPNLATNYDSLFNNQLIMKSHLINNGMAQAIISDGLNMNNNNNNNNSKEAAFAYNFDSAEANLRNLLKLFYAITYQHMHAANQSRIQDEQTQMNSQPKNNVTNSIDSSNEMSNYFNFRANTVFDWLNANNNNNNNNQSMLSTIASNSSISNDQTGEKLKQKKHTTNTKVKQQKVKISKLKQTKTSKKTNNKIAKSNSLLASKKTLLKAQADVESMVDEHFRRSLGEKYNTFLTRETSNSNDETTSIEWRF